MNLGAGFFGWLVAMALAILLTSIVGAVAAAVGSSARITQTDAQREAGTVGVVAGVVLLCPADRLLHGRVRRRAKSRFDGAKQGMAVWLIGLIVTVLALVAGAVFGRSTTSWIG